MSVSAPLYPTMPLYMRTLNFSIPTSRIPCFDDNSGCKSDIQTYISMTDAGDKPDVGFD